MAIGHTSTLAQCSVVGESFSLEKAISHVMRKANYKHASQGLVVRKTWSARLRILVEGNAAADRYRRNAYEASQRISAVTIAENYRAVQGGSKQVDLSNSALVKSRFWRQDNIRFNADLQKERFQMPKGDRWALRLSRWAHHANGVTELGAAPTGLLLKSSRLAFQPKTAENTMRSQLRVLAALGPIAAAVSLFSLGVWTNGVGKLASFAPSTISRDIRTLIGCFSALSAFSALVSLGLGSASSIAASKLPLSESLLGRIQAKQNMHIERLCVLLESAKNKPSAQALLCKALEGKIPEKYRTPNGVPVLLDRLLTVVREAPNTLEAHKAMKLTIGSYLTESDPSGEAGSELLNLQSDKSELLRRENHFVALTNLIEHPRIDEQKGNVGFKDLRHQIEGGVENARDMVLRGRSPLLRALGFHRATTRTDSSASGVRSNFASKHWRSAGRILENSHQYGPLAVGLARASEALRVINHGVVLSFNYQLTRPFAWLAGRITEGVFKEPNSRCASFSIGRFISSSIWAVLDAFLIISLAGGHGVGLNGPELRPQFKFPLMIPLGVFALPISITSTAAQMILIAVPAALLMGAAKLAADLEGWNGNIVREPGAFKGRDTMAAWA